VAAAARVAAAAAAARAGVAATARAAADRSWPLQGAVVLRAGSNPATLWQVGGDGYETVACSGLRGSCRPPGDLVSAEAAVMAAAVTASPALASHHTTALLVQPSATAVSGSKVPLVGMLAGRS